MIAEDDRSHHQQKLTRQNCFCGLTIAFVKVESDRIIRQKKIKRWRLEFFLMPGWFLMIKPQIEFWLAGFDRLTRRAISRKRCPDLSSGDKTLNEKFLWRKIATTCRVQCVFFSWTAYFSLFSPHAEKLKAYRLIFPFIFLSWVCWH